MHLSYFGAGTVSDERLYLQDVDELLEWDSERHKKPIKFKQERIFPAQKKNRMHRRKRRLI